MNYWEKRLIQNQEALFNSSTEEIDKILKKYYRQSMNDVQFDVSVLYDQLVKESADGKIKTNDLYRYNRYFQLISNLNSKLRILGEKEININNEKYTEMYNKTSELIKETLKEKGINSVMSPIEQENALKKVIENIWCEDGKHWSNRIWTNKDLLQRRIEKGLIDSISRGLSKDQLIGQLREDFNVGFNVADRLARTELTNIQNQAAKDRYQASGIQKYKYLAEIDGRTSTICKGLNGQIFDFKEAVTGANFPPCHPFAVALLFQ